MRYSVSCWAARKASRTTGWPGSGPRLYRYAHIRSAFTGGCLERARPTVTRGGARSGWDVLVTAAPEVSWLEATRGRSASSQLGALSHLLRPAGFKISDSVQSCYGSQGSNGRNGRSLSCFPWRSGRDGDVRTLPVPVPDSNAAEHDTAPRCADRPSESEEQRGDHGDEDLPGAYLVGVLRDRLDRD